MNWTSFSPDRGGRFRPVISISIPLTASLAVLTFVQSVKNLRSTKRRQDQALAAMKLGHQ
jgi:hypothetical protein